MGLINAILIYISIVIAAWFLISSSSIRATVDTIAGLVLFALVMYSWFAPKESAYIE